MYKCVRKPKLYANVEFIPVKKSHGMSYTLSIESLNVLGCHYQYGFYSIFILAQFVGSLGAS